MQQLGHTDPAFTLRVYAHDAAQRRRARTAQGARQRPRLGTDIGHTLGTKRPNRRPRRLSATAPRAQKAPHLRGFPDIGAPGFEPGTSPTRTVRATRLRHAPNG